jgi:hypothetical protein
MGHARAGHAAKDEQHHREAERLAGEAERLQTDPSHYSWNHHRYAYTGRGLYLEQLRRLVQHFPRSQLLVLQSERLFRDPSAGSAAVFRFWAYGPIASSGTRPSFRGTTSVRCRRC